MEGLINIEPSQIVMRCLPKNSSNMKAPVGKVTRNDNRFLLGCLKERKGVSHAPIKTIQLMYKYVLDEFRL